MGSGKAMTTSELGCMVCSVERRLVMVRVPDRQWVPNLAALGGRDLGREGQWAYAYGDEAELTRLFAALRDIGVPFQGGESGWPPAELFAVLREKGTLQGSFLEAVFGGPSHGWTVRQR